MPRLLQIAQLGHPVLRETAGEVPDVLASDIQELIDDMLVTTSDVDGVGLAAPQVYHPKRIIIVASRPNARYPHAPLMEPTAMLNPVILSSSLENESDWEGCLSIPGIRGLVSRAKSLVLRYQTRTCAVIEERFEGFVARIVMHEVDHLNGLTFLERVGSSRDLVTEREFFRRIPKRESV